MSKAPLLNIGVSFLLFGATVGTVLGQQTPVAQPQQITPPTFADISCRTPPELPCAQPAAATKQTAAFAEAVDNVNTWAVAPVDSLVQAGAVASKIRQRVEILTDIRNAEARLLAAQSNAISKAILNGAIAEAVQKRENEEISLGKAAYTQEVQNVNRQMIASIAMIGNLAAKQPTANTPLIAQEVAAESANNSQHDAIQLQISGVASQTRVDLTLLGKQESVSAASLEELRSKLRLIYAGVFPDAQK